MASRNPDVILGASHRDTLFAKRDLQTRGVELEHVILCTCDLRKVTGLRVNRLFVTRLAFTQRDYLEVMNHLRLNMAVTAKDDGPLDNRLFYLSI